MRTADSIAQIVYPKYPRPARLSDPGGDFSPDELEAIIRKKDADLTETDLICIFQGTLPAGEYRESVYFLPLALKHVAGNEEVTLCENLLRWTAGQRDGLSRDGLYDELLNSFESLFAELTSQFVLGGEDYPQNCDLAETIIETLNAPDFNGLGDRWLEKYTGKAETYEQAAWLVWFLERHLWGIGSNSEFLKRVTSDKKLQQKAYELILPRAMNDENLLQFWDKLFTRCGIG